MMNFDDNETKASATVSARVDGEAELVRSAGAGNKQAFDQLYDRYFARASWYFFTIFTQREARGAVKEVMTELFSSLSAPSGLSFAERAYRIAVATELRHAAAREKVKGAKAKSAKVESDTRSNAS